MIESNQSRAFDKKENLKGTFIFRERKFNGLFHFKKENLRGLGFLPSKKENSIGQISGFQEEIKRNFLPKNERKFNGGISFHFEDRKSVQRFL